MKYYYFLIGIFLPVTIFAQSTEEKLIEKQLNRFQNAHNNRSLDSMMMVISSDYHETFLPNVVYNASTVKDYYAKLISNNDYRSVIDYKIESLDAEGAVGTSNVTWDYIIYPRNGKDTLYYARNRGFIKWQKEDNTWKMDKVFAGNLKEVNHLTGYTTKKAIETELLDWLSYYNAKNVEGALSLFDKEVKGISSFNGAFILYDDIKQEYERLFDSERINITYELDGLEDLKYSGDMAYSIEVWNYKVYNNETKVFNNTPFRHLSVWQRKPNGRWKIISFVRKAIED